MDLPGHGARSAWVQTISPTTLADLAWKYAALERALGLAGTRQARALRGVARRWPGALREGQLLAPEGLAARAAAARRGARGPGRSAAWWREQGMGGLVLWASLHELLRDQLAWRRSLSAGHGSSVAVFMAYLARRGQAARARWPATADELAAVAGPRVRPRQAYLWLAHRVGLSLPELNAMLFERRGPWDHRPGDPPWARGRPPVTR